MTYITHQRKVYRLRTGGCENDVGGGGDVSSSAGLWGALVGTFRFSFTVTAEMEVGAGKKNTSQNRNYTIIRRQREQEPLTICTVKSLSYLHTRIDGEVHEQ